MYILIDLSEKDQIHLVLFDENTLKEKNVEGRNRDLLAAFDSFLREEGLKKDDVRGVMAVVGAGGFTSTRLAVTVANTFAFVQRIPVLAVKKHQANDVQKLIPELQKQPIGQYISAEYSGEANIGKN